ncbi:DeoR family transcriptional regulator [Herbiconiux ginsengi]|uniref:Lactose phosphotransferase system repressor n=1 Tax=Herbiconiux ginsengi TaxID=381665 RepID=A0A1H3QUY6_9MICO|nr:DeoR family transcriptional regulator [Herbiconiux ginsengi]SDZ16891.1 transcriptional regulator, DeoR family [Herbiconiux ginsengi]
MTSATPTSLGTGQKTSGPTPGASSAVRSRRAGILASLADAGRVEVGELARTLGVAEETVRRDLRSLEAAGLLVRAHGGAIPPGADGAVVAAAPDASDAAESIRALALAVLELLPDHAGVYLDGGPVGEALAAMLPPGRGIRIVTASVPVALAAAAVHEPSEIHLLGGAVGADGGATGVWARDLAATLSLDLAVIEPTGLGANGRVLAVDPDRAAVTESVAAVAGRVLLIGGSHGLSAAGLAGSIPLAAVDEALLDPASATRDLLQRLAEDGVAVRVVEGGTVVRVERGDDVRDVAETMDAHPTEGVPA